MCPVIRLGKHKSFESIVRYMCPPAPPHSAPEHLASFGGLFWPWYLQVKIRTLSISIFKNDFFPPSAFILLQGKWIAWKSYLYSQLQRSLPIVQFSTSWTKSRQLIKFKWCQQFNNMQYSIKVPQDGWTCQWLEMQTHTHAAADHAIGPSCQITSNQRGAALFHSAPPPIYNMLISYSLMQIICKLWVLRLASAEIGLFMRLCKSFWIFTFKLTRSWMKKYSSGHFLEQTFCVQGAPLKTKWKCVHYLFAHMPVHFQNTKNNIFTTLNFGHIAQLCLLDVWCHAANLSLTDADITVLFILCLLDA